MTIGIKYCGGCNPRYDRKGFLDRIKKDLQNTPSLAFTVDLSSADLIIKLSGCSNACVSEKHDAMKPLIHITDSTDYDSTLALIKIHIQANQKLNTEKAMNTF